jgi:thiol-disulfide isomerase/thioredoxin
MILNYRALLVASLLLATPLLHAKGPEDALAKQVDNLPYGDARSAAMVKLSADILALPPSVAKVNVADKLAFKSIDGDPGMPALQAVADTLSKALADTPLPAKKDVPPAPYFNLAKLVRYEHLQTTLADPLYVKAAAALAQNDADIEKIDFTLKDLKGKKVTLSALRGKTVLINFWNTSCGACNQEMIDLNLINQHLATHGLVILSIDAEQAPMSNLMLVNDFITKKEPPYTPIVLQDPDSKVTKMFHAEGAIPRTYVLGPDGKLVGVGLGMRTQHQFLVMIVASGVKQ